MEVPVHVGARIRRFRQERGFTLSKLAELAKVSKGYLSSLEGGQVASRPSAETLYALARALGLTIADLLGRELFPAPPDAIPESLEDFAREKDLPPSDVRMLASIKFRGGYPQSKERWAYIYDAIRMSTQLDHD